jgi:hypothetical protein
MEGIAQLDSHGSMQTPPSIFEVVINDEHNHKERKELKERTMKDIKKACDQVRQTAYDIHVYHGHGHLEKVYENVLAHRLEDTLIVELKTAKALANEHEAQILGYLKSARLEHGLLINFGSYKFEIRKFAWSDHSKMQLSGTVLNLLSALFAFFAVN